MQFLYKSGEDPVFMNRKTFEQLSLKNNYIGTFVNYLKEGDIYQILVSENIALIACL